MSEPTCCPTLNKDELRKQLSQVDAAIATLMAGGQLTELRVGSNEFSRMWKRSAISLDALRAYRKDLADALAALCVEDCPPLFRKHATIPLIVTKRPIP